MSTVGPIYQPGEEYGYAEPPERGMSDDQNFTGHGGQCGEHRTVGPHRAWCYACQEWCYPSSGCDGCLYTKYGDIEEVAAERDAALDALAAIAALTVADQSLEWRVERIRAIAHTAAAGGVS